MPPPIDPPADEPEDKTQAIVDRMFDDSDPVPPKKGEEDDDDEDVDDDDSEDEDPDPNPDEGDDESEDEEEQEEEDESEDDKDDPDPNAEEDFDKPLKKKKDEKAKDSKEEEEIDPAAEPKDETMARKMAKENGQRVKVLTTELQTTKLDLQKAADKTAELERELAEVKKVKSNPREDPKYRELKSEVMNDVRESEELMVGITGVERNFGELIGDYLDARSAGDDREKKINALRAKIIEKCVKSDVPFEEMDDRERLEATEKANQVMKVLRKNAGPVSDMMKLEDQLSKDSEEGSYVVREREYSKTAETLKPFIDGFGELADDVIEASPHAIESVVAKLIQENPAAARRAATAKKEILELLAGPRPLSKAEVEKMKAEGQDVKAFENDRNKAFDAKKKKLAAYLFQGMMTRSMFPEMAAELAELKGTKQDEESEIDTLLKVNRRKTGKKTAKVGKDKTKVGTSAREAIFGSFDDDDD